MAEKDDLERTEQPTPRRIQQAREEGQVARSRELGTLTLLAGGGLALILAADFWREGLTRVMRAGLAFDRRVANDPAALGDHALTLTVDALLLLLPLLGATFVAGIAGATLIGGWNYTNRAFVPRFSRLNPITGLGNLLSLRGAAELVKAVLKALAIGTLTGSVLWLHRDDIAMLATQPFPAGLAEAGALVRAAFLWLLGAIALVAAIDVPIQLRTYLRRLRMSTAEVRRENRELEGDPKIKARIRQIQRERARRRMMAAVPTADVVVTNPTHYAVALKYDATMAAPRVVAKGVDAVAQRIRELAAEHRVPVVEAPALARALFRHTELDHPIPRGLFEAVAIVLAYVFQLRDAMARGREAPPPPTELPVPPGLDPLAAGTDADTMAADAAGVAAATGGGRGPGALDTLRADS